MSKKINLDKYVEADHVIFYRQGSSYANCFNCCVGLDGVPCHTLYRNGRSYVSFCDFCAKKLTAEAEEPLLTGDMNYSAASKTLSIKEAVKRNKEIMDGAEKERLPTSIENTEPEYAEVIAENFDDLLTIIKKDALLKIDEEEKAMLAEDDFVKTIGPMIIKRCCLKDGTLVETDEQVKQLREECKDDPHSYFLGDTK